MTDCTICLCKNGKIYRELGCGHRFHHKCLSLCQTKTCPLCRTPYENIVLRERRLSASDKLILNKFLRDIKSILNDFYKIEYYYNHQNNKLIIINTLLKYLIENKQILLARKFGLDNMIKVLKKKITYLAEEIIEQDANLKKKYITQYKQYSTYILKAFQKA
jgi:hypothetical protein